MDTIDTSLTFGQWVRKNRKEQEWTQPQLGAIVGYSSNMIRKIEAGQTRPSELGIARILDAFGIVPDDERAIVRWVHSTPLPARAQAAPGTRLSNRAGLAASAPSTDGTLPTWPTPLIGRDTEQAALTGLLTEGPHRILTLTGPGGIGKTRLAVQAAGVAAPGFPDGVWFTDLSAIHDPDDMLPHIARTLRLPCAPGPPVAPPLSAYLAPRRALLVLDNAEHLSAAGPQIAALVTQAPHLTVLVTSRCPLHLYGEQVIPVRGLAVPPPHATPAQVEAAPAGHLLVERVRALDPEFTVTAPIAPALAAICTRLDGLPLALELAAAHLRVLSPAALLARLDQPQAVLTGGARDLPARQQSLGASLDWSYGLLTDQQQTLFRRLAAVPDGARLHEIARICNPAHDLGADVYVLLEALVDQHLVQVATGPQDERYFYLPALVRAYAAARLAATPADPADRQVKQPTPRLSERPSHLTLIVPCTEGLLENTSSGLLTKPGGAMSPSFTPIPRRPPDPCSHAPPLPCYRLSELWAAQAGVGVAATPDHGLGLRRRPGAGTRNVGRRVRCGKLPVGGCRCPSVMVPVFVTRMMRNPAPAGVIFALLLGGNTLRVLTESLAYLYGEPYYLLMGISGFIEVAGLACYAVLLWRALDQPSYGAGAAAQAFQDVTGRAPTRPVIALDAQPPKSRPSRRLGCGSAHLEPSGPGHHLGP